MRLYHFTAQRFVGGIRRDGLTKGLLLESFTLLSMKQGFQWLTSNPSWDQGWAEGTGRLPYRRDEVRFTVDVPEGREVDLVGQNGWKAMMTPATAEQLTSFGDPENWYVFRGYVPAEWIVEVEARPRQRTGAT